MALNAIELITRYSTRMFDEAYALEARSSVLDESSRAVEWVNAKTVRIPKMDLSEIGNYKRNNSVLNGATTDYGYPDGQSSVTWEEKVIRVDRAISYTIEYFDNEESGGVAIGHATDQINRTKMIPDIDRYVFSELASYASTGLGNIVDSSTLTKENIYDTIFDGIKYLENHEVPSDNIVIFASFDVMKLMRSANVAITRLIQREVARSDGGKRLGFTVDSLEGYPVITVPSTRFKTGYQVEDLGYSWSADSKAIDFIIVDKEGVLHIVKYTKVKILSGDIVLASQKIDGYLVFARVYHDLFVLDNKRVGLYVHTGASTGVANTLDAMVDKKGKITAITLFPEGLFAGYALCTADQTIGSAVTGTSTPVGLGSDVSAGGTLVAVVNGKVFAKQTIAKIGD